MAEEWILENAHLRMCVSLSGRQKCKVYSRGNIKRRCYVKIPPAACFRCCHWPIASPATVFIFHGQEIVLPRHHADEYFFLHGDGWLQRWGYY